MLHFASELRTGPELGPESTVTCPIRFRRRWRSPAAAARENEKERISSEPANHSPQMSNMLLDQVLKQLIPRLMQRFDEFAHGCAEFRVIFLNFAYVWPRLVGSSLEPESGG